MELGLATAPLTGCVIRTRRHTLTAALFITAASLTLTFDHLININVILTRT